MEKKKYYKKILSYFKEQKLLLIIYAITSIFIVIFSTISPVYSAKLLTSITNAELNNMLYFAILVFAISLCQSIINFVNSNVSSRVQDKVEIQIKEDVSTKLFDLEMKNFDKEGTGFFATRLNNEPRKLASIFTMIRYNFTSVLSSIGIFIYVFYISYVIGIFFMIFSIIIFIRSIMRTKRYEKERKTLNAFDEKYTSDFDELIRGIKDIKVLNLKNILINKTVKNQKKIIDYNFEIGKKDSIFYIFNSFLYEIMDLLLIVVGVFLISNNYLSGANFLIIFMYKGKAIYFIDDIASIYRSLKDFNISLERLYEITDGSKYKKEIFGSENISDIKGKITFNNVLFSYDKNNVLNGLSFEIKPNETIGIVGKSGAGKTTIFNLINKLYTVDNGNIFIDGIDINDLDENTIRNGISTITQNPYIFNMSIKDNLKIINKNLSDEEIKIKCKDCLLDEYIESLPKKYDTLVGENGVILSGGLKQRLAIARALLKKSKIILLDEATSSLDNETQDYIHKSIKKIRKDYTILIIAHRLSTVIDCDKIMVLDKGKLAGFDSHENLIKNNNYYKKLYKKELMK